MLFFTSSLLMVCANEEAKEKQQQLEKIQQQILARQAVLDKTQSELNQVEKSVAKTDRKIGQTSRILKQTEDELQRVKAQLNELKKQKSELESTRDQQLDILSAQVKSAYHVGRNDYLKLLLNQDSPAKLERVISYYQYLNKARMQAIENLKVTLQALQKTEQLLNKNQLRLAELIKVEAEKQAQLVALKKQQQAQIKQLAAVIVSESQRIENLKQNENALTRALEALAEAIDNLPQQVEFNGLAEIKGRLLWPVKGRVQNIFGRQKSGQLKWKGVRIDADSGDVVNNVHAGQVIFSDWLKGYGLVIVVEHGDGYMSLYGHNQALLKDVGDMVHSGEPIALVGQSGGQSRPGLYFEIRHQGQPLDPTDWCN
ncbi:murein hydrolase activator EnvC family protein [Catenovulum sediminis]|nr:peptidoglycan DD-metalloendopeptidase family protein [Catenovulum sediminis]